MKNGLSFLKHVGIFIEFSKLKVFILRFLFSTVKFLEVWSYFSGLLGLLILYLNYTNTCIGLYNPIHGHFRFLSENLRRIFTSFIANW